LQTARSDYVAAVRIQPSIYGDISARFRFDQQTLGLRRLELVGTLYGGPLFLTTGYTYIAAQPTVGFFNDREAVTAAISYKLDDNWSISANGNYSLRNSTNASGWISNGLGLRYADECFVFSVDYLQIYAGFGDIQPQRRVTARITLRTLGEVSIHGGLGSTP